jgi:hypothetical protein
MMWRGIWGVVELSLLFFEPANFFMNAAPLAGDAKQHTSIIERKKW